jgi:hypothetical protein
VTVLSSHEHQLWNDIVRFYAAKAEEPAPPEPRRPTRIACAAAAGTVPTMTDPPTKYVLVVHSGLGPTAVEGTYAPRTARAVEPVGGIACNDWPKGNAVACAALRDDGGTAVPRRPVSAVGSTARRCTACRCSSSTSSARSSGCAGGRRRVRRAAARDR